MCVSDYRCRYVSIAFDLDENLIYQDFVFCCRITFSAMYFLHRTKYLIRTRKDDKFKTAYGEHDELKQIKWKHKPSVFSTFLIACLTCLFKSQSCCDYMSDYDFFRVPIWSKRLVRDRISKHGPQVGVSYFLRITFGVLTSYVVVRTTTLLRIK